MQYQQVELPNKQTIAYAIENKESADQQVIVLIHGNFSESSWWNQTIQNLKDTGNKIIAVDLRGFGRSSYINKCHRFKDWAQDVIQLLKILKVQKCVLIGWSFGGAVSQKVAELAPNLVTKLILTCTVSHEGLVMPNAEGTPCKTPQQIQTLPKIAGGLGILSSQNKQAMRNIFNLMLFSKMEHIEEKRKAQLAESPFQQRCYLQLLTALANSDINTDNIKAPTLLIHGTGDVVIPVQTIMGTAGKLGKLDLWEGNCHMIPIEDTKRYTETVKKFMSG